MLATTELLSSRQVVPWLIDGRWEAPSDAATIDVTNPATCQAIGRIAYGQAADATRAADAASAAFDSWAERSAGQRADILQRAAEILASRAPDIGDLLSAETGKRRSEAAGEVNFSASYLRWFASQARQAHGEVLSPEDPARRHLTLTRPVGVVASLTPWNFPVSIQARKIAPALAAGCTVVARASEKAPLAVAELFRALQDAGLPDGVANLVQGPAATCTDALIAHSAVRMVTFTGSTPVGSRLMAAASKRIVRCALELGGDAPFIIFADADIDAAVSGLMTAKFRNNGQSCIGANRVLVERPIFDEVVSRLAAATSAMAVGDPAAAAEPDLGPLIDASRVHAVGELVDEAVSGGAHWLGESPQMPAGPCYSRPGFIVGAPDGSGLATTEVFGPVSGVFAFDGEDEALAIANGTEMGLAGYFYTRDVSRVWRMSERLEVGIVGVNHPLPSVAFAPMGGVKQSGLGREGARQGLEEFLDTRYVSLGL